MDLQALAEVLVEALLELKAVAAVWPLVAVEM